MAERHTPLEQKQREGQVGQQKARLPDQGSGKNADKKRVPHRDQLAKGEEETENVDSALNEKDDDRQEDDQEHRRGGKGHQH